MEKFYPLIGIIIFIVTGCAKLESTEPTLAPISFTLNSSTANNTHSAYITQVVDLVPSEEKGSNLAWVCNFGDGTPDIKGTTITQVSHMYIKGGLFKVSFTTNGNTSTQTLKIYPGLRSYQIKNSVSKDVDLITYLGKGQTDRHIVGILKVNTLSDTIYVSALDNAPVELTVSGTHKFINIKDPLNDHPYWTRTTSPQLTQYQHTVVELNDSDKIYYNYFLYNLAQRIDSTLGELLKY